MLRVVISVGRGPEECWITTALAPAYMGFYVEPLAGKVLQGPLLEGTF